MTKSELYTALAKSPMGDAPVVFTCQYPDGSYGYYTPVDSWLLNDEGCLEFDTERILP